jgi:hypothetical protein
MLQAAIVLFAHHHCRRLVALHQVHRAAPKSLLDGSDATTLELGGTQDIGPVSSHEALSDIAPSG